jgi:hypothetical protein
MPQNKAISPAPAKAGSLIPPPAVAPPATATKLTVREMQALRDELSNQLTSAINRRADLNRLLQNPLVANRPGLEVRVAQLDGRISEIEDQIAVNGRNMTSVPNALANNTSTGSPFGNSGSSRLNGGQVTALTIVFFVMVLFPVALTFSRLLWRRGSIKQVAGPSREETARLDNIERGIEAIAIEMERVTEGQRYVTKILTERQPVREVSSGDR